MNTNEQNIKNFSTPIDCGLNDQQVKERVEKGQINLAKQKYSKSYLSIFASNICTFFNLLGLICFVALLLTNATISQFFFVFFYVANISIGILQEIRAKKCIDKLSLVTDKGAKVIRNGVIIDVSTTEIVLDDLIKLGIGNQIPADCIVVDGYVEVNESLLTGESVAVKKEINAPLLAGSFITSGTCIAQAVKVGKDNYVETLSAKAKEYKKPKSEIMNSLAFIIKIIGFAIVPIAIAFLLKSLILFKLSLPEAVLGCVTFVVGMIPAGMFLLTSMALAVGIIKLARHNTLVQDLYSLEMLARVDTVCFDKTGTITDGKMSVKETVPLCEFKFTEKDVISSMINALKDNNQTALALYNYFGDNQVLKSVKTLPFNSKRKLSAVSFENEGTYAFGAPEFVLSDDEYSLVVEKINSYASQGFRVLILAHSPSLVAEDCAPNDFKPLSLIIIADSVREDAIDTIKWFKENDVAVKVISGDNPVTVSEVSKRVGIDNADKYISLEGLTDQEVYDVANKYTVFGRVSPEQKAILVKALKDSKHTVAMTGDGVNDILALKEADCAITVAAGSDAARNVSHLVLTDNNFNSMPKIVYEGRRVINNVQSSASLFLMKTLFTMLIGIITLCLPHLSKYPFVVSQMIILEMFIIGIPATFLSIQPNDARLEGRFISYVMKKSIPGALIMVLSVILVEILKTALGLFPDEIYTTMQVFLIYFSGSINLYHTCKPLNRFRSLLFFGALSIVSIIVIISVINGFAFLELCALMPLAKYWHHLLFMIAIIILDIPLAIVLRKIFDKINFKSFNKTK